MIYENNLLFVEEEKSEIPWLKVVLKREATEFSQCTFEEKSEIFRLIDIIEKAMILYYAPKKINIASFGNYMPQVHWHVMARFEADSYFPEPMWGKKQREMELKLPSFEKFIAGIEF